MKSRFTRKTATWIVAGSILILVAGCSSQNTPGSNVTTPPATATPSASPTASSTPTPSLTANSITYKNAKYGFNFSLPASWKGFSIVTSKWQGFNSKSGGITQTGPLLSIRHPLWTVAKKRQDIPILILTLKQWSALKRFEFNMGAAPIDPSELGRNSHYVFALPARYNYAFPTGYEEVDRILQANPLHPY